MKTIASFQVNHDYLKKGIYTSRVDGYVVTYDIRMKLPNGGDYLENAQMHTFEHLFATYARNTPHGDEIVYVGPMGCRTGFYLLVRDSITPKEAIKLVQESCEFIAGFSDKVPGTAPAECGNAAEHDLAKAKEVAAEMSQVLKDWTVAMLDYKYHEPV